MILYMHAPVTCRAIITKYLRKFAFIILLKLYILAVADPGFPVGGGRRPPTWALFAKNVCENERIGSCWGEGARRRIRQ